MAPTIRLREGVNTRLRKMFDCTTDGAVAEVLGIDASQYSRVYNERSSPGPNFVARLLIATDGKATFDDLFEVVEEKDAAPRPLRRAS
jgi:transcriptional regulator with XRE-family HTH domain